MNPTTAPGNIGVYIHVPFCKHACPYCDFYKVELRDFPARSRIDFSARCARELEILLAQAPGLTVRHLDTIYFGGGTPSTLPPEGVAKLVESIRSQFARDSDPEITLEANPENLTPSRCLQWRAAGINRLSIGVQSFHPRDLKLLERLHDPELIPQVVANARAAGIDNVSLDLMFALPGQSIEEWMENLTAAVALEPEHLSFYGLTWHDNTPFLRWLEEGRLAETDEETQAAMYLRGAEFLESHGYEHYEISNFARPGRRSRHNQRYWTRQDVLPLGPGAHGNVGAARWANPDDLETWGSCIDDGRLAHGEPERLTEVAALGERLFTFLRRSDGIARAGDPTLHALLDDWRRGIPESEKWIVEVGASLRLTRQGWLVSDAIIRDVLKGLGV